MEYLKTFVSGARDLFYSQAFTLENMVQFLVIMAAFALGWLISRKIPLQDQSSFKAPRYFDFLNNYISISRRELLLWAISTLLLVIATLVFSFASLPSQLLGALANLTSAWLFIRLSSGIIRSQFWSRFLAFFIWTIAALNILGWLEMVIAALSSKGMTLGKIHLTPYLVIKAVLIFALLLWAARVLSAMSERTLIRIEGLTPSHIVLFGKLIRISLLTLAVLIGLNVAGIDLTALAVFSGAIGIGIGFGMQKVFGNLVSGFILLLDRSIKPGDVIAIGETYGWVNKLGARYVSILTRDGKEHLIPNESLITQQVENWSYSDDNIRIHIPVSVSFDSDIHLVRQLLMEVVVKDPRILNSPKPTCLLKGFGESSVDFEIRAWIEDPINGIGNIRSNLYFEIWDIFKKHNIKIPYPQRDIHIKTNPDE